MATKPQAPDTVAPEGADIAALKAEHGSIRQSTIKLITPIKRNVTFIWRVPLVADLATYRDEAARNGEESGLSRLLGSVVVAPVRVRVLGALNDSPLAIERFCNKELLPLLGGTATIETTEL